MLKIAICDDEEVYVERIQKKLKKIFQKENRIQYEIHTFLSGEKLYESGGDLCDYHIFFLDINMETIDGFTLARTVRKINKEACIVLVTAFIDYAIDGYKVSAFRFILKDMLEDMLNECMNTILQGLQMREYKVSFDFIEGVRELYVEDIIYVESHLHKLTVHVLIQEPQQYTLYEKLDSFQNKLAACDFLRVHKSYLVNMKYIQQFERYQVTLMTRDTIPIPRDKYQIAAEKYYAYKGKML